MGLEWLTASEKLEYEGDCPEIVDYLITREAGSHDGSADAQAYTEPLPLLPGGLKVTLGTME